MDGTSGFSSLCHKPVKPTLSTVLINRRNISWRTDTDLLLGTEPTLKEQKSAAVSAIFKFGSSFTCNRHESGMRWYHFILAGYSLSQRNNWTQVFWETVLCRTRCVFVNKIASTVLDVWASGDSWYILTSRSRKCIKAKMQILIVFLDPEVQINQC